MFAFYIYTDQTYTPQPYSRWATILAPNFDKVVLSAGFGLVMTMLHGIGTYFWIYLHDLPDTAFDEKTDLEVMIVMFISYMSGWLLAKKL